MSYLMRNSSHANLLIVGLFLLALTACQKDFAEPILEAPVAEAGLKSYPGVDRALWPFFERFEIAAAEQNLDIDLIETETTGVIEEIDEENVAGLCSYSSNRLGHIVENMIVFHELGHCVLGRGHKEGQFTNGQCVSIMRSGVEPCRDIYNASTKDYYLEELFNPERFN